MARPVGKEKRLLLLHELEVMRLEARLREGLVGGAQAVRVAAAVVELDSEDDFRFASRLPHRPRFERREIGALHAVVRVRCVEVLPLLRRVATPRSAARQTTRVRNGREPRSAPRIVAVDVEWRVAEAGRLVSIDRDSVIGELANKSLLAQVRLPPSALVIARRAANEAPLRVPWKNGQVRRCE